MIIKTAIKTTLIALNLSPLDSGFPVNFGNWMWPAIVMRGQKLVIAVDDAGLVLAHIEAPTAPTWGKVTLDFMGRR